MSNTWLGYAGTIGELTVSTQNPKHKKGKLVLLTKKSNDLNLPRKKKRLSFTKKTLELGTSLLFMACTWVPYIWLMFMVFHGAARLWKATQMSPGTHIPTQCANRWAAERSPSGEPIRGETLLWKARRSSDRWLKSWRMSLCISIYNNIYYIYNMWNIL